MNKPEEKFVIPVRDIQDSVETLEKRGFRLESLFPAEEPKAAILRKAGVRIKIEKSRDAVPFPGFKESPPEEFLCDFPEFELTIPNPTIASLVSRSSERTVTEGRAGMIYEDIFPDRFGGFLVASRIQVPGSGKVPDYVHYHRLAVQVLFCLSGSALLVYESQGDPFLFSKGDLILQPPGIKHRVLESFDDLEVLEISCPASHETRTAPETVLPNEESSSSSFNGQRFLHLRKSEFRDGALAEYSGGHANASLVELDAGEFVDLDVREFSLGFVIEGSYLLGDSESKAPLGSLDAFSLADSTLLRCRERGRILILSFKTQKILQFEYSG